MIPAVTVCVPARNEEKLLGGCLASVREAERVLGEPVEIVVCVNRCTDRTEEIARAHGAVIVREDAKNLAKIRNAAVRAASAEIVCTVDADSRLSPGLLREVRSRLASPRSVGGGVRIHPERLSLGIVITMLFIALPLVPLGVSGGLFWFRKRDFLEAGGFDEAKLIGEDIAFALRMKAHGRQRRQKFESLWREHIVTSCRKFDQFGDWHLFNPRLLWKFARGTDRQVADRHWYEIER